MTLATVAVCTHDRVDDVARCLEQLAPQANAMGLPVLVVDSGSAEAVAADLRRLAYERGAAHLRVDEPGLSLARNAAHRYAEGCEWIVYLDDDAIPSPDWARRLSSALSEAPVSVALIGGRISPLWPSGFDPHAVTDRWKLLLSCVERADRGAVSEGFNVCGANLAVRRADLDRCGGFPTTLGRYGTCLSSGEESILIERLAELGLTAHYDPAFAVGHVIASDRTRPDWIARRAYWEGVSRVSIVREMGRPMPASLSVPKLLASLPVLAAFRLSSNPDYVIRYNMVLGALARHSRGLRLTQPSKPASHRLRPTPQAIRSAEKG